MNKSRLFKAVLTAFTVIAAVYGICQKADQKNLTLQKSGTLSPSELWIIIALVITCLILFSYRLTKQIDKRNKTLGDEQR